MAAKRPHVASIRFSEETFASYKAMAERAGMSFSGFMSMWIETVQQPASWVADQIATARQSGPAALSAVHALAAKLQTAGAVDTLERLGMMDAGQAEAFTQFATTQFDDLPEGSNVLPFEPCSPPK